jgi:hypothetical protein
MPNVYVDFEAMLNALAEAGVEFIVVGGVAAYIHGSDMTTIDLDLVYSRDASNLLKLEKVLRELQAVYRPKPEITPDARRLDGPGRHLLMTRLGPMDILGDTAGGGYPELIGHTEDIELEAGHIIRVLDLPTLIQIKESLAGERDLAVLPILRRLLAEKKGW